MKQLVFLVVGGTVAFMAKMHFMDNAAVTPDTSFPKPFSSAEGDEFSQMKNTLAKHSAPSAGQAALMQQMQEGVGQTKAIQDQIAKELSNSLSAAPLESMTSKPDLSRTNNFLQRKDTRRSTKLPQISK